ncbi:uncharacterized protein LOC143521928 [Brachyhypopomus gauderio]|uniref:uncharacterized protein LOC143521928 n=1 Tax=Brachyhypopomus gauderio TaxID=698409 RepID=UPI004042390C
MPQVLSKSGRGLKWSLSTTITNGQSETVNTQRRRNKFRRRNKRWKPQVPPVAVTAGPRDPRDNEDWEKEIEELSRRTQKEKLSSQTYDSEDELNEAVAARPLYSVPSAPHPSQHHYSPASHHVPPVNWVHHVHKVVVDQFTDADE